MFASDIPAEELPVNLREKPEKFSNDFLDAVRRLVYGVDSIVETLPELWEDERDEILDNLTEVRNLWPEPGDL